MACWSFFVHDLEENAIGSTDKNIHVNIPVDAHEFHEF